MVDQLRHGRAKGPGDLTRDKTLWLIFFYLKLSCAENVVKPGIHTTHINAQRLTQDTNNSNNNNSKQTNEKAINSVCQQNERHFSLALTFYKGTKATIRIRTTEKNGFRTCHLQVHSLFTVYYVLLLLTVERQCGVKTMNNEI